MADGTKSREHDLSALAYEPRVVHEAARVVHEADRQRWTVMLGPDAVGALTYQFTGKRYVLITTHVDEAFRHRGLATTLVARALDDIRRAGKTFTVICPFVGDFVARHPEYADLVDAIHPGPGASGSGQGQSTQGDRRAGPTAPDGTGVPSGDDATTEQTATIMVLGAVAYRGPLSPDGVTQTLDEWGTHRWSVIPKEAIDRQIRAFASAGLIEPSDSTHRGEAAYRCTKNGRAELRRQLRLLVYAEEFQPFNLVPLLHFVEALSVDELADGLRRRVLHIDDVLEYESRVIAHAPADGPDHRSETVRLDWHRFDADRTWTLGFIGRLYGSAAGDTGRE